MKFSHQRNHEGSRSDRNLGNSDKFQLTLERFVLPLEINSYPIFHRLTTALANLRAKTDFMDDTMPVYVTLLIGHVQI